MASITTDPGGRRRIQFVAHDGSRKAVRLGAASLRDAEQVCRHIEALAVSTIHGQPVSRETAVWLAGAGDALHGRLARVGLVEPRAAIEGAKLGRFIDGYLAQRAADVKPGTMKVMKQAQRHLVRFVGADAAVGAVSSADADAFRAHLINGKRARSTVNKWTWYARHYFEVALRRKLIESNPFGHLSGAVTGDPAKRMFIPATDVARVVEAAPDPQWKLLIALGRWGGLRIPSEALALTWRDVDFAGRRFIVRSSKTAHHEDGGVRVVPMFNELAEHFQRVFDEAEPGAVHVITRYRDPAANLRTQLVRYVTAAGLKPWPKPWQNLRVSRATELADEYPSHVCAGWLGHSERVADSFYRQVTDEHFLRAVSAPQSAAHNPAQLVRETGGSDKNLESVKSSQVVTDSTDSITIPLVSETCKKQEMGGAGFEPA